MIHDDQYFMTLAYLTAMRSPDPRTTVGAVILDREGNLVEVGFNDYPVGVNGQSPDRKIAPEKYNWIEHAERNAIYRAARRGISIDGGTMYTNMFPCANCARGIIQSGLKHLIYHRDHPNNIVLDDAHQISFVMMSEAGISMRAWTGKIIKISAMCDGKEFEV